MAARLVIFSAILRASEIQCTLMVIVFSANAGNVINTRREVVEAVSLMLFKS